MRTTNKRVAELSATLPKIEQPFTETAECEMYGIAEEVIGYNSRFACYYDCVGWDWAECYNSVVLQMCEEYQVLRFYQIDTYMSGEGMRKYYENSKIHADDDDWFENEEDVDEYFDELEIKDVMEYKQIWIDKFGNTETIVLDSAFADGTECFVKMVSIQPWLGIPSVSKAIKDNVEEWTSFCHTYNEEPTLEFYLSQSAEYLLANEPSFYQGVIHYGKAEKAIQYFNTFRIAHRHGFQFPTDYVGISYYFEILDVLRVEETLQGKQFLNAPHYICPTDLHKVWQKMDAKRKELIEIERLAQMKLADIEFREHHSYLFGIEFDSPSFHFKSLDSIEEYYNEGKTMHHCIYTHHFYNYHNYLSMHIADHEGNRVATCTINVEDRTINQIQPIGNDTGFKENYGIDWKTTKEYREIYISLMKRMDTFPLYQEEESLTKIAV